jgi:hypothetical protein
MTSKCPVCIDLTRALDLTTLQAGRRRFKRQSRGAWGKRLHLYIDELCDSQAFQLSRKRVEGKHGTPGIAVGIWKPAIACFERLDSLVQSLQFVDGCLQLGVRHLSPFAVALVPAAFESGGYNSPRPSHSLHARLYIRPTPSQRGHVTTWFVRGGRFSTGW